LTKHAPIAARPIPLIDLEAQRRRIGDRIDAALARVFAHCQFVLGPEVRLLEADLARFCGAREVIACGSGTDALALILRAKGLRPGEAVICPSFTFAATAEVVAWFGATPVFVDVDPMTFNIDPASLEAGVHTAKRLGLRPVGVIPVDLFGHPADYEAVEPICTAHGMWLVADAAQSFGAVYRGRRVGTIGLATAVSFYPSKPLACYGDGGAVFTDDPELAGIIRSLRAHGHGTDRYDHVRIGMNSRLDTLQAAVLIEKLKIFPDEIARRNAVAARYNTALEDVVAVPRVADGCVSTWAQYTIRIEAERRAEFIAALKARGIPTAVHYPKALHQQGAYRSFPLAGEALPLAEALAREVVSLPMHPYLEADVQDFIIETVRETVASGRKRPAP
jgi:dTDP-4-amino-4,6-dideoxygalactose transaminase